MGKHLPRVFSGLPIGDFSIWSRWPFAVAIVSLKYFLLVLLFIQGHVINWSLFIALLKVHSDRLRQDLHKYSASFFFEVSCRITALRIW